jgi:hypothetical protein
MMTMIYPSERCLSVPGLREAEQRLYRLPPLEGLFLAWQAPAACSPVSCARHDSLLLQREQELGPMTLPAASIALLATLALDALSSRSGQPSGATWATRPLSARIVRHAASRSAAETQALLPPHVLVQKTVLVSLDGTCLLCTGAGDVRLTRRDLRRIGRSLALSRHAASHATINPASVDPVEMFGMQEGMVSSFLPPAHQSGLAALVLLPDRFTCHGETATAPEQDREIALSLSLWESLLLPLRVFRPLVEAYSRRACPALRVIALESEIPIDDSDLTYSSNDATTAAPARSRTAVA